MIDYSGKIGKKDRERQFVIGTSKGILYSKLNPYSPGGGRKEDWYTDVADVVMEMHPNSMEEAIVEIKKKVLEDILHAHGIVHGRIVSTLTQVNEIWFIEDDIFEDIIDTMARF